MSPPPLKEQILNELKNPKFAAFEEFKEYQFWKAVRCEFLGALLLLIFLVGSFNLESSDLNVDKEFSITNFSIYNSPEPTRTAYYKDDFREIMVKIEVINSLGALKFSTITANRSNGSFKNLTRSLNDLLRILNKSYGYIAPQPKSMPKEPSKMLDLDCRNKVSPLKFALLYGGITGSLIQIFGQISGAHTNPAITLSHLATGHITIFRGISYVVAQGLGSCLGTFIAQALTSGRGGKISFISLNAFSHVSQNPDLTLMQKFGIEFLATFTMIMLIFSCLDPLKCSKLINSPRHKDRGAATWNFIQDNSVELYQTREGYKEISISGVSNFAIMMTIYTSAATMFGSRSGMPLAIMNPIIHLGPAVLSNCWKNHWIHWLGPMLGAIMAAFTYEYTCTVSSDTAILDFKRSFRSKREASKLSKNQKTADNIHSSLTHKMVLRPEVGGASCKNMFNGMTEPLAHTTMTTNLSTPDQDFPEN